MTGFRGHRAGPICFSLVVTLSALAACTPDRASRVISGSAVRGAIEIRVELNAPSKVANAQQVAAAGLRVVSLLRVSSRYVSRNGTRVATTSIGSGVAIAPDVLITNEHVIAGARQIMVSLPNGRTATGRILGLSRSLDLGIVRVAKANFIPATWASDTTLSLGQTVYALGSAAGDLASPALVSGVVEGLNRDVTTGVATLHGLVLTDAPISSGFSGGPLLDADGRVTALLAAQGQDSRGFPIPGLAYAIPSNAVLSSLARVERAGSTLPRRPDLGLALIDGTSGLIVNQIVAGGPAEKSGIAPADLLQTVDGAPVKNSSQLQSRLGKMQLGHLVRLGIKRGRKKFVVAVRLGNAAAPT